MKWNKDSKKQAITSSASPDFSLIKWFVIVGIALFVFVFPYKGALFNGYHFGFESSIYEAIILSFALLALTSVYLIMKWRVDTYQGILSIVMMLLPFIYWLSSMQAVSSYYASFNTLIIVMLSGFFLIGLYFAETGVSRKTFETLLMLSIYVIVVFGIANLFGQLYYPDALWLAHDGYRLASVFQYSNTYAGFLTAAFLMCLYYVVHCDSWYIRAAHAFMFVPIWISFLLTYSRGAIVVIPVVVLILLMFFRLSRQLMYTLYLGLTVVLSFLILGKLSSNSDAIASIVQPADGRSAAPISLWSELALQSWLLLIGTSLILAILITIIHPRLYAWLEGKSGKLSTYKWSFAAVPAFIISISLFALVMLFVSSTVRGLLPDKIAVRFDNINLQQHSVLERWTFYRDGIKIAHDYPLLGAGGGAWPALYEAYQNNPYWSRQAHSYFVQTLVEIGWLGLAVLIGLLAYAFILYIRAHIRFPEQRGSHIVFFIFALTVLLHSAIDFDMSYIYLSSLVFLCLGCMLSPFAGRMTINRLANIRRYRWKYVFPTILAVLSLTLLFVSASNYNANRNYQHALHTAAQGQNSLDHHLPHLEKAIHVSPDHPAYLMTKIDWLKQAYNQTKDQSYWNEAMLALEQAKRYDPYNRQVLLEQYRSLKTEGKYDEMLMVLDESIRKFQWDIKFYEVAVMEYYEANERVLADDPMLAKQYRKQVLLLSDEVQRRIDQLQSLPDEQKQGRSFEYTAMMLQVIDQVRSFDQT